jgi:RNA polymerase sigma-70 factor (ECF subfamily)
MPWVSGVLPVLTPVAAVGLGAVLGLFRLGHRLGVQIQPAEVNGQPGATCLDASGDLINVLNLDICDGAVQVVRSVVNPEKLHHLGTLSQIGRRTPEDG